MKIRRSAHTVRSVPAQRGIVWSVSAVLLAALCAGAVLGCDSGDGGESTGTTSTSLKGAGANDITGVVGADIEVGEAIVNVRALEVAFQPAMPAQRLSDKTPTAPASGEGFYQAYVRVENDGGVPIRVDPNDFLCMVGNALARIEPTRSGPLPRSLIEGTSLDLLLTFKAPTGYEPVLLYSPPWFDGVIMVSPEAETPVTTSTEG